MIDDIAAFLYGVLVGFIWGVIFAVFPQSAHADTWAVSTVASYHTDRTRTPAYNERNWGLGFEHDVSDNVRVLGGYYKNSFYRESVYLGASWTPVRFGPVRLGAVGGAITGYDFPVLPMAAGLVQIEGESVGLNIMALPPVARGPGVFGLQFKARF